ncbi:MAG: TlyA family RNA methyltransferase [Erysipelotrichaceae bacterium]|nr:TlyA family RNA methyltransferase [Erysipelotrichaceae bacterium]
MEKNRLDVFLVENSYAPSRSKALELIKSQKVMVNKKIIIKPSFLVSISDEIIILQSDVLKYVSRGGLKLERAINMFDINMNDYIILDIGASTGGFSDCCLKHNAKKVYSLDVGSNQLSDELRNNAKIVCLENTNFKDVNKDIIKDPIDLYVCDVSFISIRTILKTLKNFDGNFTIIILFKPQFEVGKSKLNSKGVVKNKKFLIEALTQFDCFLKSEKIGVINMTYSPIVGFKEGNIEFLFYLKNNQVGINVDYNKIVNEAENVLKVKTC